MAKHLRLRAADLAKCLIFLEGELRSGSLERRLGAVRDLERVENLIESLRLEVSRLTDGKVTSFVTRLDFKVSSIRRSNSYKISAWLNSECFELGWLINQTTTDPLRQSTIC